jgi:hypothetical protein
MSRARHNPASSSSRHLCSVCDLLFTDAFPNTTCLDVEQRSMGQRQSMAEIFHWQSRGAYPSSEACREVLRPERAKFRHEKRRRETGGLRSLEEPIEIPRHYEVQELSLTVGYLAHTVLHCSPLLPPITISDVPARLATLETSERLSCKPRSSRHQEAGPHGSKVPCTSKYCAIVVGISAL